MLGGASAPPTIPLAKPAFKPSRHAVRRRNKKADTRIQALQLVSSATPAAEVERLAEEARQSGRTADARRRSLDRALAREAAEQASAALLESRRQSTIEADVFLADAVILARRDAAAREESAHAEHAKSLADSEVQRAACEREAVDLREQLAQLRFRIQENSARGLALRLERVSVFLADPANDFAAATGPPGPPSGALAQPPGVAASLRDSAAAGAPSPPVSPRPLHEHGIAPARSRLSTPPTSVDGRPRFSVSPFVARPAPGQLLGPPPSDTGRVLPDSPNARSAPADTSTGLASVDILGDPHLPPWVSHFDLHNAYHSASSGNLAGWSAGVVWVDDQILRVLPPPPDPGGRSVPGP